MRTKPGVILDYDTEDNLISFELLDASKRVTDTRSTQCGEPFSKPGMSS
jgi:Protein of unknown function (DUF2283)